MGIEEAIGATIAETAAKGAEAAGAVGDFLAPAAGAAGAAGAADAAGAIALPEIVVEGGTAGALGAGELGAADAAAIGASAAGAIPDILVPAGAAAGGGLGIGDLVAGAGAAAAGLGSALVPSAAAGEITPNTIVSNEFDVVNKGITQGDIQPTGGNMPNQFNAPTAPSAQGATTASAPSGVSPPTGADPTAALSGSPGALDNVAAGATPSGAVSGAGTTPEVGAAAPANIGAPSGATAASTAPKPFSIEGLVGSAGKSLAANPVGAALGAGGLIYSVMNAEQMGNAQKALKEQAGQLNAQGQQLMNYLTSGTLPPGLKASLDQATAAAKAKVISNYAAQGLNTNPTQNSALAQQLAMIDQQAVISISQIGQQLFTSGLNETGLSSQLYSQLVNIDQTQTANIGKAIASFAAAVSPSKGLTLNLGASKAA